MSLDLGVYTELFLPGRYRDNAQVQHRGFGRYTVYLPGAPTIAGELNRNSLRLYDPESMARYPVNAFAHALAGVDAGSGSDTGLAGTPAEARAALKNLPAGMDCIAFYTLDQVMDYETFLKWVADNAVQTDWCTLCVKIPEGRNDGTYAFENPLGVVNMGVDFSHSCAMQTFDETKYPLLTAFSLTTTTGEEKDWIPSAAAATRHVTSMLCYMGDHPNFFSMMGIEESYKDQFAKAAARIEEQGLLIYGFTFTGHKEDIIKNAGVPHIAYVYADLAS